MTKHNIILQPSGRRGQIDEGTSVRTAARELGVEIESICAENATCGKCMVLIEEGRFEKYNINSKRRPLPRYHRRSELFQAQTQIIERQRLGSWSGAPLLSVPDTRRCVDQRPGGEPWE